MFYCVSVPAPGDTAVLDVAESKHASAARRLRPGQHVAIFDGSGTIARAVIRDIHARSRRVFVEVLSRERLPERSPSVHLAVAMPKGERQNVLLDMSTQLGIVSITPLHCERSIAKASAKSRLRWQRICLAACKQSGQPYLPVVLDAKNPAAFVDEARRFKATILVAHPGGVSLNSLRSGAEPVAVLIGPEGGFTEREIEEVTSQGAVAVSLGAGRLRTETAAVAAVSWLLVAGGCPL